LPEELPALLGGGDAGDPDQGYALVKPHAEQTARGCLIADVDPFQALELVRIVGGQAELELAVDAVRARDRANREPDVFERRVGIGSFGLD
jgi:hypothetical protein